jgi:hypothetical protein
LNIIVLILYRTGYGGDFLGVGGTWNLNEEKSADAEIFASGVIVGYLIYNAVQLVAYLFGTTKHKRWVRVLQIGYSSVLKIKQINFIFSALSDTIMNVVGVFLWLAVGGTAIHYWHGYMSDHDFVHVVSERAVST